MNAVMKAVAVGVIAVFALVLVAIAAANTLPPEWSSVVSFLVGMPIGSAAVIGWVMWADVL